MLAWLLDGQIALIEVEMPLPGARGAAWVALGKVVERVEVLKVWDRWGKSAPSAKAKSTKTVAEAQKEEVDELASDGMDDDETVPVALPSPLLALVRNAPHLHTLLVTAPLLPSAPDTASFDALLPHLGHLEELIIEDSPASGVRKAVEAALDTDALPTLQRVVSQVKMGKRDAAQKGKAFAKLCAKKGIKWQVREA